MLVLYRLQKGPWCVCGSRRCTVVPPCSVQTWAGVTGSQTKAGYQERPRGLGTFGEKKGVLLAFAMAFVTIARRCDIPGGWF